MFTSLRYSQMTIRSLLAMLSLSVVGTVASAQTNSPPLPLSQQPHIVDVYNIGVLDPISDRLRAQGQRLESIGNYLKMVAEAQLIEEEVKRSKLRTRIERIQHYFEVRRLRWEERELARDRIVDSAQAKVERRSEMLRDVDISVQRAAGGKGLNDLLSRLLMVSPSEIEATTKPINLAKQTVSDLRIEQGTGVNKAKVILGSVQDPYVFDPPGYFKQDKFKGALAGYQQTRARLIETIRQGGKVNDADFELALSQLDVLDRQFHQDFDGSSFASNTDPRYVQYSQGSDFLDAQMKQIGLLSVAERVPEPFEGSTVQDLVRYMADNGYRFARADVGGENSYYSLYVQMRELYKQVGVQ